MSRSRITRRALLAGAIATGAGVMLRRDTLPRDRETVTLPDGVLHFARAGDGPPLVLLHGATGSLRDWTFAHMARFAGDWSVIAVDRPGLGGSDPAAAPSLSAQAAMIREGMAALGHDRVTLVGHSFGGAVALAWALDAPQSVAGMVLLGAPSHEWEGSAGRIYEIAGMPVVGHVFTELLPWLAGEARIARAVEAVFAPQPVPDGYAAHLAPRRAIHPPVYRRNARQVLLLKDQLRAMTPRYPSLAMPVEIVHGEADTTVWPQIHSVPLAAAAPGARLHLLPGIGHMPHHGAPEVLEAALARLRPT